MKNCNFQADLLTVWGYLTLLPDYREGYNQESVWSAASGRGRSMFVHPLDSE